MTTVAVVAHRKKTLDGGLDQLRRSLTVHGVDELIWHEVPKSRKAPAKARAAVEAGAGLLVVWGGDGTVQRCLDAVAGCDVPVAIVPAGTANLLATNLGIPHDLEEAVRIAFEGDRRRLDLGRLNGEHFAVMGGAGFDALLIRDADRGLKEKLGQMAYVWTGVRHVRDAAVRTRIDLDGQRWFEGEATCVLVGNVGTITGGIPAFDDAVPDDGWLDVGVTTAKGAIAFARTFGRMAVGRSDKSPFVRAARAKKVDVRFERPMAYELDGGHRGEAKRLKVRVRPGAVTICTPPGGTPA